MVVRMDPIMTIGIAVGTGISFYLMWILLENLFKDRWDGSGGQKIKRTIE